VKIAVDVCVGRRGIDVLRVAGHEVVVAAEGPERDETWLDRAVAEDAEIVITGDKDAIKQAKQLGFVTFKPRQFERGVVAACRFVVWIAAGKVREQLAGDSL